MKSILVGLTLLLSSQAFAKPTATEAVTALVAPGIYKGVNGALKCTVAVSTTKGAVTVEINSANTRDTYTVLDNALGLVVDLQKGEVSASQSLRFPHYVNGGTQLLHIRALSEEQVEFFISNVLFDHRGEDASTYSACKISL